MPFPALLREKAAVAVRAAEVATTDAEEVVPAKVAPAARVARDAQDQRERTAARDVVLAPRAVSPEAREDPSEALVEVAVAEAAADLRVVLTLSPPATAELS